MWCQGGLSKQLTFQQSPGGAEGSGLCGSVGKSLPGRELFWALSEDAWYVGITGNQHSWSGRVKWWGIRKKHRISSYQTEGPQTFVLSEMQRQWTVFSE